jgi:hypothetical protein
VHQDLRIAQLANLIVADGLIPQQGRDVVGRLMAS